MNQKSFKRAMAMILAVVLAIGMGMPIWDVHAESTVWTESVDTGGLLTEPEVTPEPEGEPLLYDAEERTDLMENEVVLAEDIVVAAGYGFDIKNDFEGISYDKDAVTICFYPDKGGFDGDHAGEYDTYYKVTPESGRESYLVCRTIYVENPECVSADHLGETGNKEDHAVEEESGAEGTGSLPAGLSEGEMPDLTTGCTITFKMASASVMKAAAATAGNSLKVSANGYAKYCGHSMGIKYISSSGDYHNHLVYCMDINKNTTNGTVKSGSAAKVKPQVTYCLVNGARTLNGRCSNEKYSAGSATADYFITGASVHVLNGETRLSYYNNGSSVYKKIAAMVEDAKKYKESEYADSGLTKSITYDISPKKSEWKDMGDGLFRSAEKFVRTKTGTIKEVKYTITGAPSGLIVGEIKKDSSEIDDKSDLKKYDICVAQTDASKTSSNFYLYCSSEALAKIQKENATIKVRAKAYSDEKGGRTWTPTVVSQQKITFLEEFTDVKTDEAVVKVTVGNFKQGYFSLKKTDTYSKKPVAGAVYYLYEDKECEDLLCKLKKTDENGETLSGTELLTQNTYYLKEIREADGYQLDETVYPIDRKYFTIVDAEGKVTQKGQTMKVEEVPEKVSVAVNKTDTESGNLIKDAGFAIFYDKDCTKRVTEDGKTGGKEVPVFSYDEDTQMAVSAKFEHTQEQYYVKEVVVPEPYQDNGKVIPVKPENGTMEEVEMDNTPTRYGVDVVKEDAEKKEAQGDAILSGAVYGLYAAEDIRYPDDRGIVVYSGEDNITSISGTDLQSTGVPAYQDALLATVKTDAAHKCSFANLYYGSYYVKEISESEGYLLDSTVYPVNFKEEEKHKNITVQRTVKERVKKQAFSIRKVSEDGEETEYVKGAEFTVKRKSETDSRGWDGAETCDTLVTDENGYAVSRELPYGTYLVRETKVPADLYRTEDFIVQITEDSREPQAYRTLNDAPYKAYIRLVKKDARTGETILLPGAAFKIRKAGTKEYIRQDTGEEKISEFVTDKTGTVTTPLSLKYGEYECVEIKAPEGYLISGETVLFSIHMDSVVKVEEDIHDIPVLVVEMEDEPVKGCITIHKKGEVLSGIHYDNIVDHILEKGKISFEYEQQPLSGATFQVIAAEDIDTPDYQEDEDGNRLPAIINGVPATEGAVLATLTTDWEGKAVMDGLPLGKYKIVEIKAPEGFILEEEPKEVELRYAGQDTEIVYGEAEFRNARIRPSVSLTKTDEVTGQPVAGATYGLYAAEDIFPATREDMGMEEIVSGAAVPAVVKAGQQIDKVITGEDGSAVFDANLPLGRYYVREIEAPDGYLKDTESYPVNFSYRTDMAEKKNLEMKDTPILAEISKKDMTTGKELVGAGLEILDEKGKVYASWTTDGKPYLLSAIPAGHYTLKETFAPYGYLIANEVEFTVEESEEIQKVEMLDERVKGYLFICKIDSETKQPIEGVSFEIQDREGKVLAVVQTDKNGYAKTGLMDIGTYQKDGSYEKDIPYYVVESKAAKGYILDRTRQEIFLRYDDSAKEPVAYFFTVENTPYHTLPQTGGDYRPWLFVAAGGGLVVAGIFHCRRRRRRTGR